jgi:hypothetical protein
VLLEASFKRGLEEGISSAPKALELRRRGNGQTKEALLTKKKRNLEGNSISKRPCYTSTFETVSALRRL